MEEVEIEVNGKKIKVITKLPKEYIEDNNLKIFLDNTIDLKDVVDGVNFKDTNEKVVDVNNAGE